MAAPYQPGYSQLNSGRFGFRFKPEPFVDNITPAYGMDGDKNVSPPPNMNVNPNVQSQTMQYQNPGDNEQQQQAAQDQNRLEVAGSYGYDEVGKANPLGLLPGGSFLTNFLYGEDAKFNFGQPGTTDTAGNIFQTSPTSGLNRSYDPITGAPVGYAGGPSDVWGGVTDSYSKLRDAGVNPIASALGSYENSSYYIPWEDRNYGVTPAGQAGIMDTGSRLRANTAYFNPNLIDSYGTVLDAEGFSPYSISKEQLGFDGTRMEGSGLQAYDPEKAQFMDRDLLGSDYATPGAVVYLKDSGQYGVVNQDGTISTPTGTVIQTGGEWDPNKLDDEGNPTGGWVNQTSLLGSRTPDDKINPWEGRPGEGSGYEDDTKPGSFTPTNQITDADLGLQPNVNPTESIYATSTINTNWSDDIYDPVSDYQIDNTWTDEPYDPEPSFDTHDSWGGGDTFDDGSGYEDSHNYNEPSADDYSYDEGSWWNTGGQIPNRAGGK